jgi:hypothetical protein
VPFPVVLAVSALLQGRLLPSVVRLGFCPSATAGGPALCSLSATAGGPGAWLSATPGGTARCGFRLLPHVVRMLWPVVRLSARCLLPQMVQRLGCLLPQVVQPNMISACYRTWCGYCGRLLPPVVRLGVCRLLPQMVRLSARCLLPQMVQRLGCLLPQMVQLGRIFRLLPHVVQILWSRLLRLLRGLLRPVAPPAPDQQLPRVLSSRQNLCVNWRQYLIRIQTIT